MGDYDYSNSQKSCLFCHEKNSGKRTQRHSVSFLRDTIEEVSLAEGRVSIGGVGAETETLFKVTAPMIILSHSPLSFDLLPNQSFSY